MSTGLQASSRHPEASRRQARLRQALVVSPLLIGNAVMLALCMLGFYVLSATRAYVAAESHWSKNRSMAMAQLRDYGHSGEPRHFQAFLAALDVPLGDGEARLTMNQPVLDRERARAALVRGGSSPEDVDGMINLYRWFGGTELMAQSVQAWASGDELIRQLRELGLQMQRDGSPERMPQLLARIDKLEAELLQLELHFSRALGDSSRAAFHTLSIVIVLTVLGLTLTSYLMVRHGLRRQARYEAALEDANERWSLAAQSDGLGVFEWWVATDTAHLDTNACAAYGLTSGPDGRTVQRQLLRELIEPEDASALQRSLDQAKQAGEVFHHRYRIRQGTGQRYLEITGVMRGSQDAGNRRMVGIVKDVSDKMRQQSAELERAAAERTASARSEFLSRLSHELRTPLNAVIGFSDVLLMDGRDGLSSVQRHRIQLISDAGAHLLRLVDDVLDISGIDEGRLRVEREATPLAPVLAAAVAMAGSESAQAPHIHLELSALPEGLAVWGDAQRLHQVFSNLLDNACKYNRPGGRVKVSVVQESRESGDQLRVDIADEGLGLSAEEIAQLFQAFKRLPGASHQPGTGLGLTIARLLVERMGGRIEVRSTPGIGSVFSVTLQAAPSAPR